MMVPAMMMMMVMMMVMIMMMTYSGVRVFFSLVVPLGMAISQPKGKRLEQGEAAETIPLTALQISQALVRDRAGLGMVIKNQQVSSNEAAARRRFASFSTLFL